MKLLTVHQIQDMSLNAFENELACLKNNQQIKILDEETGIAGILVHPQEYENMKLLNLLKSQGDS